MGTSTLSRFQRGALAQLVNEGNKSYQVMADALGVAKATISYELDRVKPYDPELAQQDADRKRRNCGRRSMLTAALATLIQVKSITVDHGKEFANYQALEQDYQIKVYFCHPYSPWERGSNEYFNRRLRWFFPKKTNFSQVTTDEILAALELINQRPLKIHHQQTAIERFRACSD
ncbi:IS30 family transposase (plasmid) [Lactiplantibacillus plantarum]|nr:IS30 family transposase [Lactiplantibacillus plantarum]